MGELEVKVDVRRGKLRVSGSVFAGSRVKLSVSGYAEEPMLALYHYDRRVFAEEPLRPRTRIFPPEGLRCVATSAVVEGDVVLDLSTQEILDIFSDGESRPGSSVFLLAYLWNADKREVVAQGVLSLLWSPVYFKVDGTPVTMKGDKGDKGDKGKDAIINEIAEGSLVVADSTGKGLRSASRDEKWLKERITAYRNASGVLVLTTGARP